MSDAPLDPLTVSLWGSRLVEASAGTGKTWTIASLYLRLVLGHGDTDTGFGRPLAPGEILVTTFTIAATRDLSDRIRRRLVEAAECFRGEKAVAADDVLLAGLVDAFPTGAAREHAAWRLATAAEAMDDAAVLTIDGFVQRMLREHAFDSRSVFDETLEPDQTAMWAEAARDFWRREVYPLGGAMYDAVIAVWKTIGDLEQDVAKLVNRLDDDADDGADETADTAPTLGTVVEAATSERRDRIAALKRGWPMRIASMEAWVGARMADKSVKLTARYVNEWFARLRAWAIDFDGTKTGLTDDATKRLSPTGLRERAARPESLDVPPEFAAFAAFAVPHAIDAGLPAAMRLHAARRVKRRIRALKERAGIFGFHDQLERLDAALAGPSGERLRRRIVAQFPVAMIDEVQDTSPLQARVFERIYDPEANDRASALFLIGDPKQSIYAFRDGDVHAYLRARTRVADRRHRLTTNYRSTAGVVAAIDRLFAPAESRPDTHTEGAFRFGSGDDRPLHFVPVVARGRDEAFVTSAGPVPAMTIRHDAIVANKDETRRRFAERAAEQIATTLADARAGFVARDESFVRLRPADVAVLVRDRYDAGVVRRALARRGIASAYLSDQESVFESAEAADVLVLLRAVASPRDHRLARHAFATRLVGASVAELAARATDDRAFDARVELLATLAVVWREQGVLPMLRHALHRLDLPALWLAREGGERVVTNVLHLAELLQAESATLDGEQALIGWLARRIVEKAPSADDDIVRLESDADLVKVVTIHNAKGLEYPVVYLPFAAVARQPDRPTSAWLPDAEGARRLALVVDDAIAERAAREGAQEELRLLYVALTRAQHALWIGVAPSMAHGQCLFQQSAFGYLVAGDRAVEPDEIAPLLAARFAGLDDVRLERDDAEGAPVTRVAPRATPPALRDAPAYVATFERDWSIGSFSSMVRDLSRARPLPAVVDPAIEEELLSDADGDVDPEAEEPVPTPSLAARHRFPRGAFAGNFLHGQLEWLAGQRFAIGDPDVARQLVARCEREGWGARAADVVTWFGEIVATPIAPIGLLLDGLPSILPEMEFWLPATAFETGTIDRLCRERLLDGRARAALSPRALSGMLMGFADLVFEANGRYWVLDYKSNALGADDRDYHADALAAAMAAHRYDVQGALYLLALHRLLRARLGDGYEPARDLGGSICLFLRGIRGPASGCCLLPADVVLLDALDAALRETPTPSDAVALP